MLWARVRGRSNQLSVKSLRSSMNASCLRSLLVVQMSCDTAASSPYHLKSSMLFCVDSVWCTHFPTIAWGQVSPAAFARPDESLYSFNPSPTSPTSPSWDYLPVWAGLAARSVRMWCCRVGWSTRTPVSVNRRFDGNLGETKQVEESIWRLNDYMDNTVYITS